jgi:hypothetical protein
MVYKLVSVKTVIAKVFADLNLTEGDHRVLDMITWSGESLAKIGAFPSLISRVTGKDNIPIISFSNYQAKLPADLHNLIQVAYSASEDGPFYPMVYGTGSFDAGSVLNTELATSEILAENNVTSDIVNLAMDLYSETYAVALARLNGDPAIRSLLTGLLTSTTPGIESITSYTTNYTYVIVGNYIKMNVSSGYLMMAYQAIPTDKDGYPLIPDNESFLEAIYWYINMKLMYPEWREGRVRDAVYYDARRSWNYYRKQAYGEAMMPNADQLESLKNTWLRLVPNIDEHATFYSTLSDQEIIFNANA